MPVPEVRMPGAIGSPLCRSAGGSAVAPVLQSVAMSRRITQRELRNDSGRIMRALDKGKSFIVTRNGVPVGELIPMRARAFVPADSVVAAFAGAPHIAADRFRKDVDALIDQDSKPRG